MSKKGLWGVILALVLLTGCSNVGEIPIGLCITLTDAEGYSSQHGITIRNGFEMAVEEINSNGGINGKLLKAVIMDDSGSVEKAKENLDVLNEKGVKHIVGMSTSSKMPAVQYGMEKYNMLFISPSMSSPYFSGIDDLFLRVITSDKFEVNQMATLSSDKLNIGKVAIIYNVSNSNYTVPYYKDFKISVEEKGSEVVYELGYDRFSDIQDQFVIDLKTSDAQGLLIVSDSADAVDAIQSLGKNDIDLNVLVCGWAMTVDIPMLGGRTVEGIYGVRAYSEDVSSKVFKDFEKAYTSMYNIDVTQQAISAYEAVQILAYGLNAETTSVEDVKNRIINKRIFMGILGDIVMDEFGDVEKQMFVLTIEDGKYIQVR